MRTILISHPQSTEFEQKLNEYLKKIESKGQKVVDIKFHVKPGVRDDSETYYAMVLYDRDNTKQ